MDTDHTHSWHLLPDQTRIRYTDPVTRYFKFICDECGDIKELEKKGEL